MKLACASGAFDRTIQRGDLTQLEFMDRCARELACDGVVLDVRHFPRTDDDYLAQVKKFATDLGLLIVAIHDPSLFREKAAVARALSIATSLGSPLASGPLDQQIARSWSEQLDVLGDATGRAKAANITLALRNAPGTFAATLRDCKRALKETDSAWLRLGLEPSALSSDDTVGTLAERVVLLWQSTEVIAPSGLAFGPDLEAFRGALVFDQADGQASAATMQNALRKVRNALATRELNRT